MLKFLLRITKIPNSEADTASVYIEG